MSAKEVNRIAFRSWIASRREILKAPKRIIVDDGYTPGKDARDMLAWIAAPVIVFGLLIWLVGCAGIVQQPADPVTTARIRAACMADGVFRDIGGRLVLSMIPVPGVVADGRRLVPFGGAGCRRG